MPQNRSGCLVDDLRAGHDAVDGHRADHQRHHRVGRDAERQQRNEGGLRAGVVGRFRPGHALDGAAAEARRVARRASSPSCRTRTVRARRRCPAGCRGSTPMKVPRSDRRRRLPQLGACRQQPADGGLHDVARLGVLEVARISAKPNMPIAITAKSMPSAISVEAERQPLLAGLEVGADGRQQHADQDHRDRLEHRAARQHDGEHQAEHHQREIFGRAEQQRDAGQRRARARR